MRRFYRFAWDRWPQLMYRICQPLKGIVILKEEGEPYGDAELCWPWSERRAEWWEAKKARRAWTSRHHDYYAPGWDMYAPGLIGRASMGRYKARMNNCRGDVWFSLPDYRRMLCLAEEVGDEEHVLWCRYVIATIKLTDDGVKVLTPNGLPLGVRETRCGIEGLNITSALVEASGVSNEGV